MQLTRPQRLVLRTVAALALVAGAALAQTPAVGAAPIDAQAVTLSASASCRLGDVEVTYEGSGLERQVTTFTAEDGTVLDRYDVEAFASEHAGLEYILSQVDGVEPPAGTVVAVHVTIGASPPGPGTGEFFIAYRCDTRPNAEGGANEVLFTCTGDHGTCPTSAASWRRPTAAVPVTARPTFTG